MDFFRRMMQQRFGMGPQDPRVASSPMHAAQMGPMRQASPYSASPTEIQDTPYGPAGMSVNPANMSLEDPDERERILLQALAAQGMM